MGLTLPSDLFPPDVVGTVTGLSGLGAGAVSTVFTLLIGALVDKVSYVPAFIVAGTMPLLATVSILVLIRTDEARGVDPSLT
jgi:ACS family hexuronate transporter-like MFS transporter